MTVELQETPTLIRDLSTLSPAEKYFNRELSWLNFNERVLEQAADTRHPLLERVRFLAIFSNNLNEFFMVRVGGLSALVQEQVFTYSIDGQSPTQQLQAINERLDAMVAQRSRLWENELLPLLEKENIFINSFLFLWTDQNMSGLLFAFLFEVELCSYVL